MPYNGFATPVSLTPITVAFYVTNVKENGENHEVRIVALETLTDQPNGDSFLAAGSVTGNSGTSAIGASTIHPNRLVPGAFDVTQVTAAFAAKSFPYSRFESTNDPSDGQVFAYSASAAKGTWTTPASVAGVPSGLTAFFQTSLALAAASGWAAFTAPAGRLIACAGTVGGQTWDTGNGYGSSWDHVHTGNTFTGSGSGSTGTGTTGNQSTLTSNNENMEHAGAEHVAGTHTHPVPALSVSVSSVSVTGNTQAATYIPYLYALLMAEKS